MVVVVYSGDGSFIADYCGSFGDKLEWSYLLVRPTRGHGEPYRVNNVIRTSHQRTR